MSTRAIIATLCVVTFIFVAGNELLNNVIKSANTSKTSQKVESTNYSGLHWELAKVEKGDFVEIDSTWYLVTAVHHMNPDGENVLMIRTVYTSLSSSFDFNNDRNLQRVGLIVRWNEGVESGINPPIGHMKWTGIAREFFLQ
ncbi:MAG: hypothetical protein WCV80_02765 [Candidatus Paceibacterota bacterium]